MEDERITEGGVAGAATDEPSLTTPATAPRASRGRRRSGRFPQGLPVFMPLEVVDEPDSEPGEQRDMSHGDAVLAFGRMGPEGESFAVRTPSWGSSAPGTRLLGAYAGFCRGEGEAKAGCLPADAPIPSAACGFVPLVTFRDRAAGLLRDRKGYGSVPSGEGQSEGAAAVPGAVCLAPCGSIHTFFMKEAIDVAFVSREGVVLRSERALAPRRLCSCRGAALVLERPAADAPWPEVGDELEMTAGWR